MTENNQKSTRYALQDLFHPFTISASSFMQLSEVTGPPIRKYSGRLRQMKKIALATLLAVSAFSANAATELVTNGNFETGTFAGWTKSGNTSLSDVVISNTVTSNHSFVWRSGATGSYNFYQPKSWLPKLARNLHLVV